MNGKMKIELCQNQLQSENSQAEENHETEAKVEEVFKSVTHLHEVNEEDDSSCSNSLLRREMTIFHSLPEVTEGNQNIQSAFKEPDICTIPIPDKKDSKKEPPDVVEGQPVTLTPSAAVINLVDERNQCTKDDKAAHIVPNVGEYKTVIENEENALKAAKEEHKLPNGSILVKDQLQLEETTNRPKLDDIFSNSIGGSLSDSRELPSASPANQQVLVVEEKKIKPASLFPDMKVKTPEETINRPKLDEIFSNPIEGSFNRSSELPSACPPAEQVVAAEKRKPASPVPPKKAKVPSSDSEMKKSSIPIPPPLPSSTENLTDKPLSLQTCETKVDKIENNLPNSCTKKEENVSSVVGGANLKHSAPSCSTNDGTPVHEKKVNKQRPSTTPKSPPSMCQKIPPKESMMAGGECFASADGIEQETSGVTATQRRNSNTTQQRTRETGQSRTAVSRNLSKIRNEKAWRRRHLMIAGGVGIAIVCFYAFYKCKT